MCARSLTILLLSIKAIYFVIYVTDYSPSSRKARHERARLYVEILRCICEASRLTRDIEFAELVPTARSLHAAYKRQMLNSFYLRPGLDTSPRP